jgi:hypothetical protein
MLLESPAPGARALTHHLVVLRDRGMGGDVGHLNLASARLVYAEVFGRLGPQLAQVQPGWSEPLARLTGDRNPSDA